ncbi:MAG: phosphatase PAP2 family protein [Candidatus Paceibacterota bacterium]
MESLDIAIFHFLNQCAHISPLLDGVILFFAEYYVGIIVLVFLINIYTMQKSKKDRFKILLFTLGITGIARFGVMSIIHIWVQRLRPFLELGTPHLFIVNSFSFPSGHTTFVFALATVSWYYHQKMSYFIYASGLCIGIARIMAGVHYPSDIIGGVVVGIVSAYILVFLAQKIFGTHTNITKHKRS